MSQFSLAHLLLLPSVLSGVTTVLLVLIFGAASTWAYVSHSQLFYDQLFGPFGAVTSLLQAPDFFAVFRATIINNPLTYNTIIIVAAVVVGLLVYQLLEGLGRAAKGTSVMWYGFQTQTNDAQQIAKETLTKLVIRVVSFVCWVLYMLFFINILAPFCILLLQLGIDTLEASDWFGAAVCLAALLFLAVSVHLHVVFARLCLLRPRIFGGWELVG